MKTLYTCLSSPTHATCPTDLILSTNLQANYATVAVHFQQQSQPMFYPTVTKQYAKNFMSYFKTSIL